MRFEFGRPLVPAVVPNGDSSVVAQEAGVGLPGQAVGAARRGQASGESPDAVGQDHPVLEIRGGHGRLSADTFRELWNFREVLWAFAVRTVKVKYKQAVVGIGWAVVRPLFAAVIIAVVLGRFAKVPSTEGVPFLLMALTGFVTWTFFAAAAGTAMESLVTDQMLLQKVYFPREILPLATIGAALVDLVPGLLVLIAAVLLDGIAPHVAWVSIPVLILILTITATALGLAPAALNAYYRDVRYALPFVMQLGMFASAVFYPVELIPDPWRDVYTVLNPVVASIDGLRDVVLDGRWPNPILTSAAFIWALVLATLSYFIFKRLERGIADRV